MSFALIHWKNNFSIPAAKRKSIKTPEFKENMNSMSLAVRTISITIRQK